MLGRDCNGNGELTYSGFFLVKDQSFDSNLTLLKRNQEQQYLRLFL